VVRADDLPWEMLEPYVGRWVAIVRGQIAGVGWSRDQALRAAKRARPRRDPRVLYVSAVIEQDIDSDAQDGS
jgi:hypothetical protein